MCKKYWRTTEGKGKDMQYHESIQEKFIAWLAQKVSPAKLSDFFIIYGEIDSYCLSMKILPQKLLETTDWFQLDIVRQTIRKNGVFRKKYYKDIRKMEEAINYYIDFIRENLKFQKEDRVTKNEAVESAPLTKNVDQKQTTGLETRKTVRTGYMDAEKKEQIVDFTTHASFAYTKPVSFSYSGLGFGVEHRGISNWAQLYVDVVEYLFEDYPYIFQNIAGTNISGQSRLDFALEEQKGMMTSPKKVKDNLYVETNLSATDIVEKIRLLLDKCGIDYKQLTIKYVDKKSEQVTSEQKLTNKSVKNGRTEFMGWLQKSGISIGGIFNYTSLIGTCTKLAQEARITEHDLFEIDQVPELSNIEKELFEGSKIVGYSAKAKEMLRFGFRKLIKFRTEMQQQNIREGLSALQTKIEKTDSEIRTIAQKNTITQPVTVVEKKEIHSVPTEKEAHYAKILGEYFAEDGYQLGRAIFRGRFRKLYTSEFGCDMPDSDETMERTLRLIGTVREGRVYPKQDAEQNNLIEDIINAIVTTLDEGAEAVYIEAVYERYHKQLADDLQIYNEESLAALLQANANGRYKLRDGSLIKGWRVGNPGKDILRVMKASHHPLDYDAIHKKAWYIPYNKMKQIIRLESSIVNVGRETYFYAPNLPVDEAEIQQLISIIQSELESRRYVTDSELMKIIQNKCPSIAVNTEEFTTHGLRNCLGYILRDRFTFNGSIISSRRTYLSMGDVYIEFTRQHEVFSLEDIKEFSRELDAAINWDIVRRGAIRISETEFVRKDQIIFDVDVIDNVLDGMCPGEYIPLKNISLFLYFPAMGYQWNLYVLESYLYSRSKRFKLVHTSFSQNGVYGGMVRNDSSIGDYSELITEALSNSDSLSSTKSALNYLLNNGYQATLRYNGIEQVVRKAKLMKEKRETEEK